VIEFRFIDNFGWIIFEISKISLFIFKDVFVFCLLQNLQGVESSGNWLLGKITLSCAIEPYGQSRVWYLPEW
jgi:hypothetical protein